MSVLCTEVRSIYVSLSTELTVEVRSICQSSTRRCLPWPVVADVQFGVSTGRVIIM